ncbi:RraA family protein [Virgibacillus dakarensis]|nr:RraA family protein [Virgibacillus dakarensis]
MTSEMKNRFYNVEPATIGHHLHYGFMDPRIRSMLHDVKIVGTAFTVKTNSNDSTMVHKAVSLAEEDDIIVIDRTGDNKHACVGEMVAYAANSRKVSGVIIDGPCTDIQALREIGLPIFATGLSTITTKLYGISGEVNTMVQCGGVSVQPGDLILADDNGVLVIPKDTDYQYILEKVEGNEEREAENKKMIDSGKTLSSITKADQLIEQFLSQR